MDILIGLSLIAGVFAFPLLLGYWFGRHQVDPESPFGGYYRMGYNDE